MGNVRFEACDPALFAWLHLAIRLISWLLNTVAESKLT